MLMLIIWEITKHANFWLGVQLTKKSNILFETHTPWSIYATGGLEAFAP